MITQSRRRLLFCVAGIVTLLVTGCGGSDIKIDKGGPTRIAFADGVASGANQDQWIWSVATIDVR